MLELRSLHTAVLLILAWTSAGASGVLELVSHDESSVIAGDTEFRFEVRDHDPAVERVDVYVEGKLIGTARPPDWKLGWNAPVELGSAKILAVAYAGSEIVDKAVLETQDVGFAEQLDVSAVQLYPVVRGSRGGYVNTLTKDDFTVLEAGKPVDIEYFDQEVSSLTLMLLLDASSSMEGDLSIVKDAAVRLIDQLQDGDLVSVYSFNHTTTVLFPSGVDHSSARSSLFGLRAGGGTALFDAVIRVLRDSEKLTGRKAIVLFSDGLDERSLTSQMRTVEEARKSEILVYTIGTRGTQDDDKARQDLELLAEETGGEYYIIGKARNLPKVFSDILSDLRAQYILSFTPRTGQRGWRSIEVRVAERGLRVRCRTSYFYDP